MTNSQKGNKFSFLKLPIYPPIGALKLSKKNSANSVVQKMSIKNVLRSLKTVKNLSPKPYFEEIPHSDAKTLTASSSTINLSNLNPTKLHQILSDPHLRPSQCLRFFNFIVKNPSLIHFRPDLQAHLAVICRLLEGRRFSDAENLMKSVSVEENLRYPFPLLASTIEKCCCLGPKMVGKLFNMMLKVYSDNKKFDQVMEVFAHMKKNGVEIDERACTVHLIALKKNEQIMLGLDFFNRMIKFGINISAYPLTVLVDGLCKDGEIAICREFVEEMVTKGIKPNIITYNIMINACAKRWNFRELDSILALMTKEGEELNADTYKILIEGYSSFGKFEEAEKLVFEMHDRDLRVDTHLYNLIISGYSKRGFTDEAVLLFDKMTSRKVKSNGDTYWLLINGLCKAGKMEVAMVYVSKMRSGGIELDQVMLNTLIDGFQKKGMEFEATELRVWMERSGLDADMSVSNWMERELRKSDGFEAEDIGGNDVFVRSLKM